MFVDELGLDRPLYIEDRDKEGGMVEALIAFIGELEKETENSTGLRVERERAYLMTFYIIVLSRPLDAIIPSRVQKESIWFVKSDV